jgi:PAS domain S-box-containing protein
MHAHRNADDLASRLRVALRVAPMHLYTMDRDLRYTAIANPLEGYTAEQLIGRRDSDLVDPECCAEMDAFRRRVLETGLPARTDIRLALPDRRVLFYDVTAEPLRDESGKVTGLVVAALDITERITAQQRASRSEQLLQLVLDNSPAIMFIKDTARRMRWVNRQFANLLGKSPDEINGQHQRDLFPPEQLSAIFDNDDKVLAGQSPLIFEERLEFADGPHIYSSTKVPVDLDGERLLVGFSLDITQQRRDEAAIQDLNRNLQRRIADFESLLQVIPVGIGVAEDPQCRRIRVNPAFGKMLSLPATANASLSAPDHEKPTHFNCYQGNEIIPPDELPLQKAAREGVTVDGQILDIVHNDGRRVRLLEFAAPLFDEDGRPRGSVGAFVDLSERLAAEERFRLLADTSPVLVWLADAEGRRTWFNKVWQDFTGRPIEQLSGDGWIADVHPDDVERYLVDYRTAIASGQPFSLEYRLRHRHGSYRWILARGRPLFEGPAGTFSGFIGGCVDITEIKDLQRQKESLLDSERTARLAAEHAQQEAQRASRMKDEFLATLSHELRTPLNAIIGWLEILRGAAELTDTGLPPPPDYREGIDAIERNAKAQAQLIEDLLDMSRIISGRIRLDLRATDLAECIEAAAKTVLPTTHAKNISLTRSLPSGVVVSADPDRIQQVVLNLLGNAVKFTPNNGQISVTLTTEREGADPDTEPPAYAVLTVSDTGQGIEPEFLPHVFDRFRQAESATTRRHGGLGLGLALVKQITEFHGGSVSAYSPGKGQGATFIVRLPLLGTTSTRTDQPENTGGSALGSGIAAQQVMSAERLPPVAILVAEDDTDTRAVVRRLLVEAGAGQVDVAPDVDTALAYLALSRYDVLVSDISMPGRDGYDLITTVRHDPNSPNRGIPSLALTALAREEDRQQAMRAGFNDHLAKPLDRYKLLDAVRRLLTSAAPKPAGGSIPNAQLPHTIPHHANPTASPA